MTGGPARFTRNSTSPTLLGATPHQCHAYSYRTLTHSGTPSQTLHLHATFLTGQSCGSRTTRPPQPRTCNTCRLEHTHGLASSAFARHYSRNHTCFLFLRVLRCFTSPRYHHTNYEFIHAATTHNCGQVSPFGHPRINARLTTPRGLSRPSTSFIGLSCPRHPPCALHRQHTILRHPHTNHTNKTLMRPAREQK